MENKVTLEEAIKWLEENKSNIYPFVSFKEPILVVEAVIECLEELLKNPVLDIGFKD